MTRALEYTLNPEVPQSIPGIASAPSSLLEEGEVPDSMDADADSAAGGAPADAAAAVPAISIEADFAAYFAAFDDVVAAAAAPAEQSSCKLSSSTPTLMTKRPKLIEPGSAPTSGRLSSSHASFVSTPSSVRLPQQQPMAAGGTLASGNGMSAAAAAAAPAASTRTTLPISKKLLQMLQSSTAASGAAATPSSNDVLQMLHTSGSALHAATADPHAARATAGQQHLDPHASAQQVLSLLPSNASSNTAVHGARLRSGINSVGQLRSSKAGQLTSAMTAPGMNAMLTEADPLPAAAAGFGAGVKFSYGALLGGSLASMGKLPAVPGSVTPAGVMQGSAGADSAAAGAADDVDIEMLFASEEDALGGTGGGSTAPGQAARQDNNTTAPVAKPVAYTHYLKGARDFCKRMGTNKKAGDEQVAAVAKLMQFVGEHWQLVETLKDSHLCIKEFEEEDVAGSLLVSCMHLALLFGSPDALAKKQQLQQDPEKFWESQQEELGNIPCNSIAGDGTDDYEAAFELALCKSKTKFNLTGKDRKLQSESGGCSSNFKTPKDDENFRRAMSRFKVMMTLKYKCQRMPVDELPEALQRLLQELPGPAQPTKQSMPATVTGQNRAGMKRGFGEINFLEKEPNHNLAAADPMQQ
jgi:hypothetical protein